MDSSIIFLAVMQVQNGYFSKSQAGFCTKLISYMGDRSPKLILKQQPISRICCFGMARASWAFFIYNFASDALGIWVVLISASAITLSLGCGASSTPLLRLWRPSDPNSKKLFLAAAAFKDFFTKKLGLKPRPSRTAFSL
jgi:hypothetical protein